uniref:Uncharacterized protein n=1 Tax=Lepeophtheirus salmonis TaxID=72036 RepID=A0A0K2UYW9_LEPSM
MTFYYGINSKMRIFLELLSWPFLKLTTV